MTVYDKYEFHISLFILNIFPSYHCQNVFVWMKEQLNKSYWEKMDICKQSKQATIFIKTTLYLKH